MKHFVNAIVIVGIMLAATARADTLCTTELLGGVINGNVIVPNGAFCGLTNVTVTGNVLVGSGAAFRASEDVTISGNLQADHCASVEIVRGFGPVSVGGNVEIQHCTGLVRVGLVTITGNLHVHNNSSAPEVVRDSIGGNADVSNNSGGASAVSGNSIGGNLQCAGNDSVTGGLPNTVAGTKLVVTCINNS